MEHNHTFPHEERVRVVRVDSKEPCEKIGKKRLKNRPPPKISLNSPKTCERENTPLTPPPPLTKVRPWELEPDESYFLFKWM